MKLLVIKDVNGLNRLSLSELESVDIIVASSKIFSSAKYWENLETFAGQGKLPANAAKGGRFFVSRYNQALLGVASQVELLKTKNVSAVVESIENGAKENPSEGPSTVTVPSKRLKGQHYRKAIEEEGDNSQDEDEEDDDEKDKMKQKAAKLSSKLKLGRGKLVDVWGLTSNDVRRDWKKMKCPPFEMIHFVGFPFLVIYFFS